MLRTFLLRSSLLIFLCCFSCGTDSTTNKPEESKSTALAPAIKDFAGGEKAMSPQDPFVKRYKGILGKEVALEMQLTNWGDGFLAGYYWLDKEALPMDIHGEMQLNETVTLETSSKGEKMDGKFVFSFTDLKEISGLWSDQANPQGLAFQLKEVPLKANDKWSGQWHLNGIWEGGTLLIGDLRDTAFHFALSFVRNGHVGEIDGEALLVTDTTAIFNQVLDYFEGDEEVCLMNFTLRKNQIEIFQKSDNFACGFGMRAYASGYYDNQLIKEDPTLSFGDQGIFVDAAQHDEFKSWIGEKMYHEIAFNMHAVEQLDLHSEEEKLKGKLSKGLVMGMLTSYEAIILHDGKSAFWTATIAFLDGENNTPVIRYFTNQADWKKKLPKAFDEWRAAFSEYKVIFEK